MTSKGLNQRHCNR